MKFRSDSFRIIYQYCCLSLEGQKLSLLKIKYQMNIKYYIKGMACNLAYYF